MMASGTEVRKYEETRLTPSAGSGQGCAVTEYVHVKEQDGAYADKKTHEGK